MIAAYIFQHTLQAHQPITFSAVHNYSQWGKLSSTDNKSPRVVSLIRSSNISRLNLVKQDVGEKFLMEKCQFVMIEENRKNVFAVLCRRYLIAKIFR